MNTGTSSSSTPRAANTRPMRAGRPCCWLMASASFALCGSRCSRHLAPRADRVTPRNAEPGRASSAVLARDFRNAPKMPPAPDDST